MGRILMAWKEVKAQTRAQVRKAKDRGHNIKCLLCSRYMPLMQGDELCFKCHVNFLLNRVDG